jgi:hypothetical protein
MAVLRLADGSDVVVRLTMQEVVAALQNNTTGDFVELPGEEAPLLVRAASVMAIIEDSRRGTTGFRIASGDGGAG